MCIHLLGGGPSFRGPVRGAVSFPCISLCKSCYCPLLSRKRGDIKSHSCLSVRLSVCHKNFNLGHNFCTITGRALILGMCVLCDKTFTMVPCSDLDRDLWPTSRSNLLQSGGPQFSEFACFISSVAKYHRDQLWSYIVCPIAKLCMCQFGPFKIPWGPRRGHSWSFNPPPSPFFPT